MDFAEWFQLFFFFLNDVRIDIKKKQQQQPKTGKATGGN